MDYYVCKVFREHERGTWNVSAETAYRGREVKSECRPGLGRGCTGDSDLLRQGGVCMERTPPNPQCRGLALGSFCHPQRHWRSKAFLQLGKVGGGAYG